MVINNIAKKNKEVLTYMHKNGCIPKKYANVSVPHAAIAKYHISSFPLPLAYKSGINIINPIMYIIPNPDIAVSIKFVFIPCNNYFCK